MTEQEILLQDKWLEINYHFGLIKLKWKDIIESNDKSKKSKEFKYEFNSLVNSFRSITFVLQKCFNKHKDFKEWYAPVQAELKENEFAKIIHELRNINQKEGNRYPDIVEIRTLNKYFNQRIVYTPIAPNRNKLIDRLNMSKEDVHINIVDYDFIPILDAFDNKIEFRVNEGEAYEALREEKEKELTAKLFSQINQKKSEITEAEIKKSEFIKYKIMLLDVEYEWEKFIEECERLIIFFREKCLEAVNLFA